MIRCEAARSMMDGFLNLSLAGDDETQLREHLAECRECRLAYTAAEPALLFCLTPAAPARVDDDEDDFVAAVLGGVHQARFDRRQRQRRERRFLAAAAAIVVAVAGGVTVRLATVSAPTQSAAVTTSTPVIVPQTAAEPAFVEVEGEGVRLYQVAVYGETASNVQVALVVDPRLEL